MKTPETDAYYAAFLAATGVTDDTYEAVAFGDRPALNDELCDLALRGQKRATAMLVRNATEKGDAPPVLGGHVVLLDGVGRPRAVWCTTDLRVGPLDSVDESFAWDEGEGDRTRNWWLDAHRRIFATRARVEGFEMHDGIEVYFERFTIVWPPEFADPA